MNIRILVCLLCLAFAGGARGNVEWRTFTSQDGQRSFEGQLQGYDEETSTVTVLNQRRQSIEFDLDLLSEADREYVVATAPTLPVRVFLDVKFERLQERQGTERSQSGSTSTRRSESEAGYRITIDNFSATGHRDVKVEYLVVYREDNASGPATTRLMRGSTTIDLEANGSHEIETDSVNLVNFQQRTAPPPT